MFNNLEHIQNINPSQNIFYRAVVENNNDGGTSGKCQVRILGIHSADNSKVPTANLPWAELAGAANSNGGVGGLGMSAVPLQGTWVWVFLDGGDWNKPVIIGIIVGGTASEAGDSSSGFSDPSGTFPAEDRLGTGDSNRVSTGDTSGSLLSSVKDANRDTGIPTGGPDTWEEPASKSANSEYPKNQVIETPSGNIIEMDDTGGEGRMHWFHKSGTYWEVVGSGDYTLKVVSDYYNIVNGNTRRLNKGSENHTVQGASDYKVDGDQRVTIGANREDTVTGSVKESYAGGLTCDGGGNITMTAGTINLN